MLSKLSAYSDEAQEEELSVEIFESVMDHSFRLFLDSCKPKLHRSPKTVVDYWSTNWGKSMQNPDNLDPSSKIAKLF